jgi:CAP12/Pycsar effector protein, TIR domain
MAKKGREIKEKPRIFIGSSVESLYIANFVHLALEHVTEPTVWNQGIFEPSATTLDNLIESLEKFDFAIFIFSPDDVSNIRKQRFLVTRDNVIFEMGLFVGKLGKKRVFYIIPRHRDKFHLPSDLIGVNPLDYDNERGDGNVQAALGSPCTKIIEQVNKLGRFENASPKKEEKAPVETTIFSMQENKEFERIYEKLKPQREASIDILKKHPEVNGRATYLGKCILKYSLIKVIWANINEGRNTFNRFLTNRNNNAKEIINAQITTVNSKELIYRDLNPIDTLTPLLTMLGLLEEQLDNNPKQMTPNFAFHIYSKKMYRFYDWIDYNNLYTDEPLLEFVEFIEGTK